jgi:chloramphenicol-sensitive protein RarD
MQGILLAVLAYSIWGWFPLYFHLLDHVSASEIFAHRIIWSLFATLLLIAGLKRFTELKRILLDKQAMKWMLAAAIMISINWFVYIWAVIHQQVVEASLGYFIMPVVSLMLGRVFLHERMNGLQAIAAILAVIAVGWELWSFGGLPWVGVVLSFAFAIYGLVRKMYPVDGVIGLTIETLILLPVVLLGLWWMSSQSGTQLLFGEELNVSLLLIGGGVLTAIPLILFVMATHRIDLSLVGFIQYINPTIQFLLGVYVLGESFTQQRLVTFVIVWCALAFFITGSVRKSYIKP